LFKKKVQLEEEILKHSKSTGKKGLLRIDETLHKPGNLEIIRRLETQIRNHFFKEKTIVKKISNMVDNIDKLGSNNLEVVKKNIEAANIELITLKDQRPKILTLFSSSKHLTQLEISYLRNIYDLEAIRIDRLVPTATKNASSPNLINPDSNLGFSVVRPKSLLPFITKKLIKLKEDKVMNNLSMRSNKSSSRNSGNSSRSRSINASQIMVPYNHKNYKTKPKNDEKLLNQNYINRKKYNIDLKKSPYVRKFEQNIEGKENSYSVIQKKRKAFA
jgi:hypothetical protein